ncbi:hypothetical protein [Halostella pelagica]|uniref:hypothetical protein n=1 Tax=Halostella pelagica TaxID=2583824 RepID=UPI00192A51DC|nr:hypothetical protein [Halostella pelagica]
MTGIPSPFSTDEADDETFDEYDEYVPESLPEPGSFLDGHDVLADDAHLEFHELTRDLFEERGVYDMTFGYNLARLNLDRRHPGAGYRYAVEQSALGSDSNGADSTVLRAEFTPTTEFCPQSDTLARGSFRAWNGLSERHDYDLVRVRVDGMHHNSEEINEDMRDLEATYLETDSVGEAADSPTRQPSGGSTGDEPSSGPTSPF